MMSEWLRNAILDKVYRGMDFTLPAIYVSLHESDPGQTGGGEVSGGAYRRQPCAFQVNALGQRTNQDAVEFTVPRADISHVGLWDAQQGGHFLEGSELLTAEGFPETKRTNAGDVFTLPPAAVTASLQA